MYSITNFHSQVRFWWVWTMDISRRNVLKAAAGVPLGAVEQRLRETDESAVGNPVGLGYGSVPPSVARSGSPASVASMDSRTARSTAASGTAGSEQTDSASGYGAPAYGSPSE